MREPVDSVGDASGAGGRDPYVVAAVVIEARAYVVATSGVDGECFSAFGTLMSVDFDAGWSEWCFVEVEGAMDLGMGR